MPKYKFTLVQNAIHLPREDRYLISQHSHDYVVYKHNDGRFLALDGGKGYIRRIGDFELYSEGVVADWCLTPSSSTAKDYYNKALWGSRGKKGDKPLTFRPISTLTREHLRSIKRDCAKYMHPDLLKVVKYWLKKKYNE